MEGRQSWLPSNTTSPTDDLAETATKAEGGLTSEACVIEEQARLIEPLQSGENLLKKPHTRC
ncbi:hypothetical protein Enr8_39830 [Blastopirellula retiformator]|uniref:Uncharacterized protein n=1 Tax=Blastopirellula retiformator TaxID=2527970 RepID=A0A5C5V2R1_9BACT|nr:hypothetical protein Enr8_39830 [Blastopirellula retiformator]